MTSKLSHVHAPTWLRETHYGRSSLFDTPRAQRSLFLFDHTLFDLAFSRVSLLQVSFAKKTRSLGGGPQGIMAGPNLESDPKSTYHKGPGTHVGCRCFASMFWLAKLGENASHVGVLSGRGPRTTKKGLYLAGRPHYALRQRQDDWKRSTIAAGSALHRGGDQVDAVPRQRPANSSPNNWMLSTWLSRLRQLRFGRRTCFPRKFAAVCVNSTHRKMAQHPFAQTYENVACRRAI